MQSTRERIAAQVRAEMASQKIPRQALADALGLSLTTTWRRLSGSTAWTVDEVNAAAAFLGVSVSSLLREPDRAGAA